MGTMARDIVLCALIVVQLLCVGQCYRGVRTLGGKKLELPQRDPSNGAENSNVRN